MKRSFMALITVAAFCTVMMLFASAACDHNWRIDYDKCVAPTCTEKGTDVYTCSRCSETKSEAVAATGHDMVKVSGEYATCETASTYVERCSVCGYEKADTAKATGHDYKETKRVAPTCSKEGSVTYTCEKCGGTKVETLATVDHSFTKFISSSATCTTSGKSTYQCETCSELTLKTVSKLGHDYVKTEGPTCTKSGKYVNTCSRCGDSYTSNTTSKALGHELPDDDSSLWKTTKKATCEEEGERRAKCTRCKEYVYEKIEKLDHDYSDTSYLLKAPTKTTSGQAKQVCAECGKTVTKTVVKNTIDLSDYKVPTVTISKEPGRVTRGTKVTLSCELEGATIYYATGGKSPTSKSSRILYEGSILIVDTTTIKAYAIYDDAVVGDSEIATFKFTVSPSEPWVYFTEYASEGGYMELDDDDKFRPDEKATRYEVIMALDMIYDSWADDAAVTFTDVDKAYRGVVRKFVGAQLLNGYEDGTFRGEANIKRSELCKVLALATGIEVDPDATVQFKDVSPEHWAYAYIAALTDAGYLAGDTDGNFRPEDNITRAELAVVLNRVAGVENGEGTVIDDVPTTHWAYGYICGAVTRKK